jgi:hypothetical protein
MNEALVKGSLLDVAARNNYSVAQAFLSADAIVMVDTSISMSDRDCPGGQSRFSCAREQLIRLQRDLPGKIAVISWNNDARFCAGGLPEEPDGGTDLTGVLQFVKPADGTGVKFILISDGQPNDETSALDLAKQFTSKIDVIFIGPETSPGRDFLRRLAEASGGQAVSNSVRDIPYLANEIQKLITTGA